MEVYLLSVRACRSARNIAAGPFFGVSNLLGQSRTFRTPLDWNLGGSGNYHKNLQAIFVCRMELRELGGSLDIAPPTTATLLAFRQQAIPLTVHPEWPAPVMFHVPKPLNTSHRTDTAHHSRHPACQIVHTSIITVG
jgi:hypothetical protein